MLRFGRLIATLGGIGRMPVAPGTVASLVAAGLWYGWFPDVTTQWVSGGLVFVVGTWAAGTVARCLHLSDPPIVVIDEFLGMWVALAGWPRSLPLVGVAFLLFRAFDVVKPPPLRRLERLPGGWGIMADDVAAGLLARLVLAIGFGVSA